MGKPLPKTAVEPGDPPDLFLVKCVVKTILNNTTTMRARGRFKRGDERLTPREIVRFGRGPWSEWPVNDEEKTQRLINELRKAGLEPREVMLSKPCPMYVLRDAEQLLKKMKVENNRKIVYSLLSQRSSFD